MHRHIDSLLFDLRRETGIGICQEKRPSTPKATRTAPRALLAFRRRAMPHNIRVLAGGAVEDLRDHGGSLSYGWFCSAQTLVKESRSTDLKRLPTFETSPNHLPADSLSAIIDLFGMMNIRPIGRHRRIPMRMRIVARGVAVAPTDQAHDPNAQ